MPCRFLYSSKSFRSAGRALSDTVFRKRKWVTPMKSFRSTCLVSLDRIDVSLLPIYTTEPFDLYPKNRGEQCQSIKRRTM